MGNEVKDALVNERGPHMDKEYEEAIRRVRKIKKFYKELASWAATSIFLIALDLFLSGGITWSKYPVFFWGIAMVFELFRFIQLKKLDKAWEDRMIKKFTGQKPIGEKTDRQGVDYSGELLKNEDVTGEEPIQLSDYREVKKQWKDDDLV